MLFRSVVRLHIVRQYFLFLPVCQPCSHCHHLALPDAPASHHWPLSLARLYPAFASPKLQAAFYAGRAARLLATVLFLGAQCTDKAPMLTHFQGGAMPLPNGSVHRFWCRPGSAPSHSPKCGVASACGILLLSGGAEAPPIRKRRVKRKRMDMQSLPLHLP